jgi:hypothetical protein
MAVLKGSRRSIDSISPTDINNAPMIKYQIVVSSIKTPGRWLHRQQVDLGRSLFFSNAQRRRLRLEQYAWSVFQIKVHVRLIVQISYQQASEKMSTPSNCASKLSMSTWKTITVCKSYTSLVRIT